MDAPKVRDPVCGMVIPPNAERSVTFERTRYYFCGPKCVEKFKAEPAKYLAPKPAAPAVAATKYTCPMHPEIVRDAPGACPICGMALEPMTPTVTDEANPELADMTRRFVFAIALTVPLFLLAMSDLLSGDPVGHLLSTRARTWIELALATPVCTYSAWPFYERFVLSLRTRHSTCSR